MSARNTLEAKRARRTRKLFRKELPAFLDLTAWLQDRGYAQTGGGARKLMIDGKIRVDSHTIGNGRALNPLTKKEETVADPIVPADFRDRIQVRS